MNVFDYEPKMKHFESKSKRKRKGKGMNEK